MTTEQIIELTEALRGMQGGHLTEPEAKVIVSMNDNATKERIAEIEANSAKKDRICNYVTSGLEFIAKAGTAVCSVLIFASGIEYEKTGSYTSPFTKSIAQNAMRKF